MMRLTHVFPLGSVKITISKRLTLPYFLTSTSFPSCKAGSIELPTTSTGVRTKVLKNNADKLAIPYVIFLGEDEIAAGTLSVKDLRAGEQVTVSRENAVNIILDGIARAHQGTILK